MKLIKKNLLIMLLPLFFSCLGGGDKPKTKCECDSACECDTKCKCDGDSICKGVCACVEIDDSLPKNAFMFFDASGSMKGYVDAQKEPRFKGFISSIFTIIPETKVYMYGVKSDTCAMTRDVFLDKLNARKLHYQDESNLIYMIKSMVESNYDLSFLVTDGIMSGSNHQIRENRTYSIDSRDDMSERINSIVRPFETEKSALVIRALSNFNGKYYPYYNVPEIELSNVERPFFLVCIGKKKNVKMVYNELMKKDKAMTWNTVVLGDDYRNLFKLSRSEGTDMKGDKLVYTSDTCSFTARLDSLPEYMQNREYFCNNLVFKTDKSVVDTSMYTVQVNKDKVIVKMARLGQLTGGGNLYYELRYMLPNWVEKYSSDDDSNVKSETLKTFNLKYFIKGLASLNKESCVAKGKFEFIN